MIEIFCGYCGELLQKQKDGINKSVYQKKTYLCKWTTDGFWAHDMLYKLTKSKDNLISEDPKPFLRLNLKWHKPATSGLALWRGDKYILKFLFANRL